MGVNATSFGQPKANLELALKNGHSPEAIEKQKKTKHTNALVKNAVYNALKDDLLKQNNKGKAYFSEYLDKFLADAKKDPNGRCGQVLAHIIFHENILEMMDAEQEKAMNRDLDFMRYRALKRLFREQRDVVLDVDKRRKLIICSRRAGKTDDNTTNMVYTAITPNSPILYINLKFDNAIKQAYDLVIEQAEAIGLTTDEGTSKSSGTIVFTNGSSITFAGNNNDAEADKLRGGKYRLIIVDECCHQRNMKYLIDEVLGPCLMDYEDSQLILTGTPPRIPHTYAEKAWNSPEYEKYSWTMKQNPYIHNVDEEIERICKNKGIDIDSPFIQREYFGKMGAYDTEAMVFKGRQTLENIDPENLDIEPTNLCLGVDFGFQDFNGIVTIAYNKNTKESRVISESKFNKATITSIVEAIQEQYDLAKKIAIKYGIDLNTIEVFCDNNEKSIVSELSRNYNINARCAWKYDKAMALEQLSEELRTGRMKIKKGGLLDDEMDMMLYKRDEEDNILPELDEDLGIHGDITMALLYASRQMFLDMGYSIGGRAKDE